MGPDSFSIALSFSRFMIFEQFDVGHSLMSFDPETKLTHAPGSRPHGGTPAARCPRPRRRTSVSARRRIAARSAQTAARVRAARTQTARRRSGGV